MIPPRALQVSGEAFPAQTGREDAAVQGHGVAAEKQLLSTLAVPISFSLVLHLSQAPTAPVSSFPSLPGAFLS